ncbi:hypothetical protein L596_005112 [Steinernema carpocapsae]|uniref:Uncharacterized protein n=1 Tax=Steinernema carpocapsae TaxID=34508 RepID=A0A4U8UY72_STECR|nr:hypothetical protein L596_005112 [Steinernema carpocapsae]
MLGVRAVAILLAGAQDRPATIGGGSTVNKSIQGRFRAERATRRRNAIIPVGALELPGQFRSNLTIPLCEENL